MDFSCSEAWGVFLDQGSNPCPLHWQLDSYPLYHQESPPITLLTEWLIHERGEVLTETPSYPVARLFDPAQNCKKMFISSSALPGVLWVMSKKLWATFGIWKILKISLSHWVPLFFFFSLIDPYSFPSEFSGVQFGFHDGKSLKPGWMLKA